MKKLLIIFFLCLAILAKAENFDMQWMHVNYTKREVMIPMRDGVRLFASIYEPTASHPCHAAKHPMLVARTPYSCAPYGEKYNDYLCGMSAEPYVRAGYIFVFNDVRGKNFSEGEFEDVRPFITNKRKKQTDEASDTYDLVEWLVHNTSSNQCVGVSGCSYPGFYATMAALSGHPAVKAVSPQAPVTDWFLGDDLHHNGVLFPMDMYGFTYWFEYENVREAHTGELKLQTRPDDIIRTDCYSDFLKVGPIRNITHRFDATPTFWQTMAKHPDMDEWWQARNVSQYLHDIKPAVMVVGGLFDAEDCYGAWQTYRSLRSLSPQTSVHLVEGPWSHGAWGGGASPYFGSVYFGEEQTAWHFVNDIEYPFFAYYLEGKGSRPSAATIFQTGENHWYHYTSEWPYDAVLTPYSLIPSKDGSIGVLEKTVNSTTDDAVIGQYVSDPMHPVPYLGVVHRSRPSEYMVADQRFALQRADVLSYETEILKDSLRLDGPVEADLIVSINTTDADFVVKLIDVYPENFRDANGKDMGGYHMLVRADIMRGKYRNSFTNPEPFVPGQPTKVNFRLPDVAHTFLPGHKMMVQIQSSWFPIADRNPQTFCNIYECGPEAFQSAEITLHSGSRILLPILQPISCRASSTQVPLVR